MNGQKLKIILTRPEPGCSKSVSAFRQKGFAAIGLPLSEIIGTHSVQQQWHEKERPDLLLVTSANGLRHLDPLLIKAWHKIPVFAVGNTTAQQAKKTGFLDVLSANGDADDLANLCRTKLDRPSTIIYITGKSRKPDLEEALISLGHKIQALETYQTKAIAHIDQKLRNLLQEEQPDFLVFYARHSAEILKQCAQNDSLLAHQLKSIKIAALSSRIAQPLENWVKDPIIIAEHPSEAALLARFEREKAKR